jgi:methylisocitrate lyase
MAGRIKAAVDARNDPSFVVMARTDALASEGLEKTLERSRFYVDAGADMIFVEAAKDLPTYGAFAQTTGVPILANLTEFGATPLFSVQELAGAGVRIALYPLSAFRAMNKAALHVFTAIRREGTQARVVETMQTREELYNVIRYHEFEEKLDRLFANED